jgi:hypothetical protein
MSDQKAMWADRLVKPARILLVGGIAVVLTLLVIGPRNNSVLNPLNVQRAYAEGGVCAAPGYILLTAKQGGAAKFFICDTNKQVLCSYEMNGAKLRLVSARKFDADSQIFDASLLPGIEGHGTGVDRKTAQAYADAIKALKDKAAAKKQP